MKWFEITIYAGVAAREVVIGALDVLGVYQFEMLDDIATVDRFLREAAPYWDYASPEALAGAGLTGLRLQLPDTEDGREKVAAIEKMMQNLREEDFGVDMTGLNMSMKMVDEEDWAEGWKKYYKPFPVGERLYIRPEWEEAGDADGRIVLTLNPGMAFGTGQHETTALCLTLLEKYVHPGMHVLDAGCGSGILSIASMLLGATKAVGVDIDDKAPDIARENAALNGVNDERFTALAGNVLSDDELCEQIGDGYDVVVANIVADVVIALCGRIHKHLKKGGVLILSGIIDEREADVRAALEKAGLTLIEHEQKNGWVALAGKN